MGRSGTVFVETAIGRYSSVMEFDGWYWLVLTTDRPAAVLCFSKNVGRLLWPAERFVESELFVAFSTGFDTDDAVGLDLVASCSST